MDHGVPWWSNTNGHGLTRFAVHLIEQGSHLIYGSVAHPQTQGKVERFHRTLAEAVYHRERPRQLHQWQQFLAHFRQEYNFIRPHEALEMAVPASRYQPSPRAYNPRPQPWDYPSTLQTKRLSQHGCLHHAGRYYFVCEAWADDGSVSNPLTTSFWCDTDRCIFEKLTYRHGKPELWFAVSERSQSV